MAQYHRDADLIFGLILSSFFLMNTLFGSSVRLSGTTANFYSLQKGLSDYYSSFNSILTHFGTFTSLFINASASLQVLEIFQGTHLYYLLNLFSKGYVIRDLKRCCRWNRDSLMANREIWMESTFTKTINLTQTYTRIKTKCLRMT